LKKFKAFFMNMKNSVKYSTYIIQNPVGKFYIGQTNNLEKRINQHNAGKSRYTKGKGPWELVHSEEFSNRNEAIKRERQLKKWRRELILNLINKSN